MVTPVRSREALLPAPTIPPLMTAAAFLAFFAAVCLYKAATSPGPPYAIAWGGVSLATFALALLCAIVPGGSLALASWKLGPWMLAWYAISYGLVTAAWDSPGPGASAEVAAGSILRALLLTGGALAAWSAGYCAGPWGMPLAVAERGIGRLRRSFSGEIRSPLAPWGLFALGVVGSLASTAATGRFGYSAGYGSAESATWYGQFLAVLSLCTPLGVAAAAIRVCQKRTSGAKVSLALLAAANIAFGAAGGGKQSFVIAALAVAIPFSAARGRLPMRMAIIAALIFLAAVIPFSQTYRAAIHGTARPLSPAAAVAAAPEVLSEAVLARNPLTIIPASLAYLLQRTREIEGPAIIMQRTPSQIPYLSPAQLAVAPVAGAIPRVLWHGKPADLEGVQVTQEYFGLTSVVSSSAVTSVGDLYRYGGWLPVLAGMFLLGVGMRVLDGALDLRGNAHAVLLVVLLFPLLVKGEVGWVALISGLPSTVLVWLVAVRVTFRRTITRSA